MTTGKLTGLNKSEAYYVRRVWSITETAFDITPVSCITGETMSTSTIDGMNEKRVRGGKCYRENLSTGRKIDWIFKQDNTELGCREAAKSKDHTKILLDGGFKC